jgi:hypothetical protein
MPLEQAFLDDSPYAPEGKNLVYEGDQTALWTRIES